MSLPKELAGKTLTSWAEGATLDERLARIAGDDEPGRFAVATSFGPGGLIILHTLHRLGLRLPVVFIDTLSHFRENLELVGRVQGLWDLDLHVLRPAEDAETFDDLHVLRPAEDAETFDDLHGPELGLRDLDRHQLLAKVEPIRAAARGYEGWFTGRRRDQSEARWTLPIVERRPDGFVTGNPLADWDRERIWALITDHNIPYNSPDDLGYASIGGAPLTTPIEPGVPERAGRWRGSARIERGMHAWCAS